MESKCLDCGENLVQLEGKRQKQFCGSSCRSNYWQKKKRRAKLAADLGAEKQARSNPLINAARGRDKNGVNEDEAKRVEQESQKEVQEMNAPTTLDELKALCPKNLTGFERSAWVATERQKYGI